VLVNPFHSFALHSNISTAVVVTVGTGLINVSFRCAEGGAPRLEELARSDGWGWMLGDKGEGCDIGREVMKEVLREPDEAHINGCSSTNGTDKGTLESTVSEFFRVMETFIPLYLPGVAIQGVSLLACEVAAGWLASSSEGSVLICDDAGGLTRGWGEVGRDPAMWMDKDPVIRGFRMDYDPIRSVHGSACGFWNVPSQLGTSLNDLSI
jgi:hypothetical protein